MPQVVLAVNKMDLVDFDKDRFDEIEAEFAAYAEELGVEHYTAIPVSALRGDNVVEPSADLAWFEGPTLLEYLENVPVETERRPGGSSNTY